MVTCFSLKFVISSFWNTHSRAGVGRAAVPTLQPHGRSLGAAWPPQAVQFPAFISLAHLALITGDVISLLQHAKTKPSCWAEARGGQFSLGLIQSFDVVPLHKRPLTCNPLQWVLCKLFADPGTPFLKTAEQYQGVPMGITRAAWCQTLQQVNECYGSYFCMRRGLNTSVCESD